MAYASGMADSGFLAAAGGRIEYARWIPHATPGGQGDAVSGGGIGHDLRDEAALPAALGAVSGGGVGHDLRRTEESGAPVLVLLHEGLGCVEMWRDWPAVLARATGCEVFAYSRLGYGGSSPAALPRPLDFMTREARTVLPQVLEAAGIGEPVLVGHSDGGTIALLCAAAGEVPIRGVVALAAHVFNEPRCIEGIKAAREAFRSGSLRGRLARYHGQRTGDTFRGWCDVWLDPGFERWSIEEELAGMETPLLVVQGRDDPYGTLRQVEAIAGRASGPCEILVLDECGHSPYRERSRATTEAVARFVASLPAGGADPRPVVQRR